MKNLLIAIAIFCTFGIQAQSELSLHFMQNIIQSNATNPAIQSPYKINISLPSIYLNGFNSSFRNELFIKKKGTTLSLDPTLAINKMEDTGNLLQANLEASFLSIAFKIKKLQISIFHNIHFDTYLEYPKDLAELAWFGNAPYVGETLEIAPRVDAWMYNEYGVGISYPVNKKLTIGGRLKVLNGYFGLTTEKSQASLFTDPDYYQVEIQSDVLVNTSGFGNFLDPDNDDDILMDEAFDNIALTQNKGFGIDLGLQYHINENITIAASVIDIGSIKWKNNVINNRSQGAFTYEGLEVKPYKEDDKFEFDEVRDSVKNIFDFKETNNSFTTKLPSKYYLSAIYKNEDNLSLGAIVYAENYSGSLNPSFGISINKEFGNVFSLGTLLSVPSHGGFNIGLSTSLRLLGVQFYAVSDNFIPLYNPLSGKNFNLRVGINVAIRGKKDKEKEDTEILEETPPETPPSSGSNF